MLFRISYIVVSIIALFLTSCGDRKPEDIFDAVLGKDKMKTAKILHSEDQDFGECCIWLHFTVDSTEFASELRNCTELKIFICHTTEFEAKWWNPEKMGKDIRCFSRKVDRQFETFYVNKNMTEVYYQNYIQ